ASLHTLVVTMMPGWIARMEAVLPDVQTMIIPDRGGIEANLEALVSGEADLFTTYAHPYVRVLPDPEQFDWITLGHEHVLPVIAPELRWPGMPRPAACEDFLAQVAEDGFAVPYLDHGPSSFIGTALRGLMAERTLARRVVHENSISVGLHEFALHGWGLC